MIFRLVNCVSVCYSNRRFISKNCKVVSISSSSSSRSNTFYMDILGLHWAENKNMSSSSNDAFYIMYVCLNEWVSLWQSFQKWKRVECDKNFNECMCNTINCNIKKKWIRLTVSMQSVCKSTAKEKAREMKKTLHRNSQLQFCYTWFQLIRQMEPCCVCRINVRLHTQQSFKYRIDKIQSIYVSNRV